MFFLPGKLHHFPSELSHPTATPSMFFQFLQLSKFIVLDYLVQGTSDHLKGFISDQEKPQICFHATLEKLALLNVLQLSTVLSYHTKVE